MKKHIITLCALIAASCTAIALSGELKLFKGLINVATIDVGKIDYISYSGNGDGYDKMDVLMTDNTVKSFNLDGFSRMEYSFSNEGFFSITESYDDHCETIVLDHYYNEGAQYSDHYHKSLPGEPVHYYYTIEAGYDAEVSIIGDVSGRNYRNQPGFEFEDDYTGTGSIIKSTAFLMPSEPITVKAVSTERNHYSGESFIGTYTYGFWINERYDNHVSTTSTPMLSAELRKNGVFEVKSTDSNNYNFKGTFTYNSEARSFTYNEDDCKTYGLEGKILSDDVILATVRNIIDDKPENSHFYWLSKKAITFVCATGNTLDARYIIEMGSGNEKSYYFFNSHTRALSAASAVFSRGTTLGGVSTAILTLDTDPYAIKYTLNSANGKPDIEYASEERGNYTGSGDDLWLDGFGGAKYGTTEGTYKIAGVEVTFTPQSGENVVFHINQTAKTYEKVDDNKQWNGPLHFSTNFTGGKIEAFNASSSGESIVELWLDHNFSGAEEKGQAKFTMKADGASMADNTVPYTYNSANNTITISYLYAYFGADGWVEDSSLVLKVSPDKKTLTFDYDYISTFAAKGYAWIVGSGTVLAAEE